MQTGSVLYLMTCKRGICMKKVKVNFQIIQEGSVTVEVDDDYDVFELQQQAQDEYDEGDLFCGGDLFEVTDYEEIGEC